MPLLSSCLVDDRVYPPPEPATVQGPTILTFDATPPVGKLAKVCKTGELELRVKFQYESADADREPQVVPSMWFSRRDFSQNYSEEEETCQIAREEFFWEPVALTEGSNLGYIPPLNKEIGDDFEDVSTITIRWQAPADMDSGLHQLRLILHHESNALLAGFVPARRAEADVITWNIALHDPGEGQCPE